MSSQQSPGSFPAPTRSADADGQPTPADSQGGFPRPLPSSEPDPNPWLQPGGDESGALEDDAPSFGPNERQRRRSIPPVSAEHATTPDTDVDGLLRNLQQGRAGRHRPRSRLSAFLHTATNGRIDLGGAAKLSVEQRLDNAIQAPLGDGVYVIAVYAQKGGVGKSTTAVSLGITLAGLRPEKVLGLDVNPDGGSMAIRVPRTTKRTILDLRNAMHEGPLSPVEFDRFVNHAPHRFDSVVMPPGTKPKHPLSADDFRQILKALEQRYSYKIVVIDCGTNLSDDVMSAVLPNADQLVALTTTRDDEAGVCKGGLQAIGRAGLDNLVGNAVTVINELNPPDPDPNIARLKDSSARIIRDDFAAITSKVVAMPYDSHISLGQVIDLSQAARPARMAYKHAGAEIIERLGALT